MNSNEKYKKNMKHIDNNQIIKDKINEEVL